MKIHLVALTALLFLVSGLCPGCGNASPTPPPPGKHHHVAPHGGTAVVLGHDEYHLELVLDAATGTMQAYVMDGELEQFVRIEAPAFEVAVQQPAGDVGLVFEAVPNRATGEIVGDTSQFTAHADWLKTTKTFDAVLKVLSVKGSVFKHVPFNFPKGNDTDDK